MTKPNLTVVEALERCKQLVPSQHMDIPDKAIPFARRQAETEATLIETREALKFLLDRMEIGVLGFRHEGLACVRIKFSSPSVGEAILLRDCPPIIKEMLGERT